MPSAPIHQLLLAEYIHRSANDFSVAFSAAAVAGRQPTIEGIREQLDALVERLASLAAIQRLLQPPRDATMDLATQCGDLCEHHAHARFAELGVYVQVSAEEVRIDAERGWILLMIVSELLTNAARHAFDKREGCVAVELRRHRDEIVCIVGDNGVGMKTVAANAGCGSAIVKALALSAGIVLETASTSSGTTVELRLPVQPC